MKIAIPFDNGRLHGHFGGCRQFALVDVDTQSRKATRTEVLPAPDHQPGLFPRWLGQHGVQVVIAGGIGQRALDLFARQGIDVRAGTGDATVEELVTAFLDGRLTAGPSGCNHHHDHDHDHDHDHHHHHHHHGHGPEAAPGIQPGDLAPDSPGLPPPHASPRPSV